MKTFNLLSDQWLPVILSDGGRTRIAPWELTATPAPVALDVPRPDFGGAMLEFLVGCVQTMIPPHSNKDKQAWRKTPPQPETLRAAMEPFFPHFFLLGERPLFMQDLTLTPEEENVVGIAALLIDSPGENALKKDTDFFVKRGRIESLCPTCAAMALFTMQAFAPTGGVGYRTSLRGGGPLSTLVLGNTLWETVWNNVLVASSDEWRMPTTPDGLGRVLPWTVPTRISKEKGTACLPEHGHPLHAFWGMPRRIRLHSETSVQPIGCDICGTATTTVIRQMGVKNYGNNYEGAWRHPLTPYHDPGQDKPPLSVKGSADGTAYNQWLGLLYGLPADSKKKLLPALCIQQVRDLTEKATMRISVFGYDMNNMEPMQWCEGEMPFYPLEDAEAAILREEVGLWLSVADRIRSNMLKAVKDALFADGGRNAKTDQTLLSAASMAFWSRTESVFHALVARFVMPLQKGDPVEQDALAPTLRKEWATTILNTAEVLFAEQAESGTFSSVEAPRIYGALNQMRRFNRGLCNKELGTGNKGGNA
ncbi:type I-E CRISPR-associated protein Cse1/CasA [Desulfovibrio psychrotolerans]|uniref:Type I-E CRISPR-associated protein Cse1/CasA n=1 Tax=Desulfovibrio psychrotolerans TaxID=415242 RepID=A0A7J0BUI5_9BACT|nr:type I-E CRISPR-associated protein Cse1/CasA [Desulfovibrio psychrotolerans]GFM37363.1 type I-E CRISPR-associated protein Cse1/CasA [Desulfovibrio psychrotolerans]